MSDWKDEIERAIHRAAVAIEKAVDRGREAFAPTVAEVEHLAAYRGYAGRDQVVASGRVLANPPVDAAGDDDGLWKNFGSLWRRVNSREVANAEVLLRFGDQEQRVTSDAEGYYHAAFEPCGDDAADGMWAKLHAEVPHAEAEVKAQHAILTPPTDARFGIISDMDDTVIHTGATRMLVMARHTLFGNARLRQPLAGVAAFYRALQRHDERPSPVNPLFYVSSSPWNLYDLLEEFLDHHGIPPGPLLLRDYGIDAGKLIASKGHGHKLEKAERILAAYPELPFVLIGDTGQDDAEIYAELAHRHGERIRAVYLRDVDPEIDSANDARVDAHIESAETTGVPMLRARDSLAMAEHAAEIGLVASADLPTIADEVGRDLEKPATIADAIADVAAEVRD